MSLIIEDGSIVNNANSLVTRTEFISYAASLGVVIADNETTDVLLIKAMNFINSHERQLKGSKVDRDQGVSYPRTGLVVDGWAWEQTEIPTIAKNCQMEFALEINSGNDLYNPTYSKGPRIEETVSGAVTVRYGTNSVMASKVLSRGFKILNSLLKSSGLQSIALVRV